MTLLEKAQAEGRLNGIQIPDGRQLLHQLFADDTGLHLQASESNFRQETRDGQLVDFLLAKFQKRLGHWSTKVLSWAGRVIILRHILALIPVYHFSTLSLTRHGFGELEKVVRAFLWGLNNEGKEKTSLVGWEMIGRPKLDGGLGLGNFNRQADVMKMRLLTKIMQGDAAEWITLLTVVVKRQARNWDNSSVNPFPLQKFLLLGPQPSAKTVKTVRWLLSGWYKARKLLRFDPRNAQIPGQLEMWKVELVMKRSLVPVQLEWRKIRSILAQCEVRRVDDFVNRNGGRRILPGLDRLAAEKGEETRRSLTSLEEWLLQTKPGEGRLENSSGWCWENDRIKTTAWTATNAQWRHLLSPMATSDPGMERKWPEGGDGVSWGNRWRSLWKGPHLERNKLWVWRILRHAFFTSARGAKMTVCESTCLRCAAEEGPRVVARE
ncbi:hypothetical protein R1sor_017316 [Riccia sorocarpa]|uniref:Reverse transcriptase zinc-binding domain-containing protein n=1 Tax=Riccia sorocarpa TaxID=122646 RepID=A0ABD3I895_9MARC